MYGKTLIASRHWVSRQSSRPGPCSVSKKLCMSPSHSAPEHESGDTHAGCALMQLVQQGALIQLQEKQTDRLQNRQ